MIVRDENPNDVMAMIRCVNQVGYGQVIVWCGMVDDYLTEMYGCPPEVADAVAWHFANIYESE